MLDPVAILFIGFVLFCFFGVPLLTVCVSLRERVPVHQFAAPTDVSEQERSPDLMDQNPYAAQSSEASVRQSLSPAAMRLGYELNEMGYSYIGSYDFPKKKLFQLRFEVMCSPDRMILATVVSGTIMGVTSDDVVMQTFVQDEESVQGGIRSMESFTRESSFEDDRVFPNLPMVFPSAKPMELEQLHRRRLSEESAYAWGGDPITELDRWRVESAWLAVEGGFASFVDEQKDFVRLNFISSVRNVFRTNKFMWGRRFYPHRWRVPKSNEMAAGSETGHVETY